MALCESMGNWTFQVFGERFQNCGDTFPVGRQKDGNSCGICVINAMESAILGTPLFTHADRYCLRLRYFVTILKHILGHVRKPVP